MACCRLAISLRAGLMKARCPMAARCSAVLSQPQVNRPASHFDFEMEDPVLKRTIRHGYDVIVLPVLG